MIRPPGSWSPGSTRDENADCGFFIPSPHGDLCPSGFVRPDLPPLANAFAVSAGRTISLALPDRQPEACPGPLCTSSFALFRPVQAGSRTRPLPSYLLLYRLAPPQLNIQKALSHKGLRMAQLSSPRIARIRNHSSELELPSPQNRPCPILYLEFRTMPGGPTSLQHLRRLAEKSPPPQQKALRFCRRKSGLFPHTS